MSNETLSLLSAEELMDLQRAHHHLEHPSLAARLSNVVGTPVELAIDILPKNWNRRLEVATEYSTRRIMDLAIASMGKQPSAGTHDSLHQFIAMVSGAIGGFFGPITLLAELPLTTALILHSIADIAHNEGEDLNSLEGRLACAEVFALGGRTEEDSAAHIGYYGLRTMLSFHFAEFLSYSQEMTFSIPAGINLIRAIAARLGIVISDKVALQMIPIAGAISGALLNLTFMQHFQDVAKGHFIVRRLERKYGVDEIRFDYERLTLEEEAEARKEYSPLEGW